MENQQNNDNQQPYPVYQQDPYGQSPQDGQPKQIPKFNNFPSDIPEFRLIEKRIGIDEREFYVITHAANEALKNREDPLSDAIVKIALREFGGQWMVIAHITNLKGYDFCISKINSYLCFIIKNFKFHILKLGE